MRGISNPCVNVLVQVVLCSIHGKSPVLDFEELRLSKRIRERKKKERKMLEKQWNGDRVKCIV